MLERVQSRWKKILALPSVSEHGSKLWQKVAFFSDIGNTGNEAPAGSSLLSTLPTILATFSTSMAALSGTSSGWSRFFTNKACFWIAFAPPGLILGSPKILFLTEIYWVIQLSQLTVSIARTHLVQSQLGLSQASTTKKCSWPRSCYGVMRIVVMIFFIILTHL